MDWGSFRPYCCLWLAVDYDGNMYCYRELYGWGGKPNKGTEETAAQVGRKIVLAETEEISYGVLDNACWAKTGVTGPSIAEEINNELLKSGHITFGKSSKGRVEGANAIKQRLIGNRTKSGAYKPALYIFSNCVNLLRTIPMLGRDKSNAETYDTNGEDHCFVAGTLITTKRGNIPIEEITTSDYVLTRKGYKKVLGSAMTKRNARIMTIEFSDGTKLTGTRNHPIYIKGKGFLPIDTITYGDIIYSVREVTELCQENRQKQQIQSYSMVLPLDDIQIPKDCQIANIIGLTADLENKEYLLYTVKFGNFITEKSPKDTTFIILMGIHSTMIFQILNYAKRKVICHNIQKNFTNKKNIISKVLNIWQKLEKKLLNGTNLKKGANGTEKMLLKLQQGKPRNLKSNVLANNVEKNFIHHTIKEIVVNFAQMPVMQSTDEIAELMMKQEFVQSVAETLELIALEKLKPVVENVVYAVCCYTEKRKADVYNLTVDEVHEYFANGILVHNCADALSYACLSRPWIPVEEETTDYRRKKYSREEERSGWTF